MSKLSEAFETSIQLQHIIPLDFDTKIQSLPKSHEWDIDSLHDEEKISSTVPVIDLIDPKVVELVGNATKTWGMFQVINHGIPLSLLQDVNFEALKLFNLPTQEKLKVLREPDGNVGYGAARISPFSSKCMWHEGFTILGGSALTHAKQLWPHDYNHFCNVMGESQVKMRKLAYEVLQVMLKSLDLWDQDIQKWAASTLEAEGALQLNSYPLCPDPSRAMGLSPHTDSLMLTILNQCDISGLQVFRDDIGSWVTVQPVPGALVVNAGDLLHIFSNAKFPSAYHRVVVNQKKHRISYAYFYGPPTHLEVAPLALSKDELPVYRSMTVKEYLGIKIKHNDNALSLVKI